jgi:putative redox protein
MLLHLAKEVKMKTSVIWKDGLEFEGRANEHIINMDAKAPIGHNIAATPKELVALGLGGCTGMDVVALLKKHKQPPKSFEIAIEIEPSTEGHPIIFKKGLLKFIVDGDVTPEALTEAVVLSQTKYCGVSAMLSESFPIEYQIILNGSEISKGVANFKNEGK